MMVLAMWSRSHKQMSLGRFDSVRRWSSEGAYKRGSIPRTIDPNQRGGVTPAQTTEMMDVDRDRRILTHREILEGIIWTECLCCGNTYKTHQMTNACAYSHQPGFGCHECKGEADYKPMLDIQCSKDGIPLIVDGMKSKHLGEYRFTTHSICVDCSEEDGSCEICGGCGEVEQQHVVPWDLIKRIFQEMAITANKLLKSK